MKFNIFHLRKEFINGSINLPENSKVQKGKYFKDKTGSKISEKLMFIDGTPQQVKIQE